MKRIISFVGFKIGSYKILIIFALVFVYNMFLFVEFINKNTAYNFYDVIINNFSYLTISYFLSFFFLLVLYNLCDNTNFYKYLLYRFNNKSDVYNASVVTIIFSDIIFIFFINIMCILESIGNISFQNQWSDCFFKLMHGRINLFYSQDSVKIITQTLTPFSYIMYIDILVFLYLFCLGLVFLISNTIFKSRTIAFCTTMILILINLALDSGKGCISKLTFTNNIFFITSSYVELQNRTYILFKLLYWTLIIITLYFIGKFLNKKIDYKFME